MAPIRYSTAVRRIAKAMQPGFKPSTITIGPLVKRSIPRLQGAGIYNENGIVICRLNEDRISKKREDTEPFFRDLPRVYITGENSEVFMKFTSYFLISRSLQLGVATAKRLIPYFAKVLQYENNQNIPSLDPMLNLNSIFGPNINVRFLTGKDIPDVLKPFAKVWLGFKQGYNSFGGIDGQYSIERYDSPIQTLWSKLYTFHALEWAKS
jgi:hypothetical protein